MILGQPGFRVSSGLLVVTPRSADIPASKIRIGGWAVDTDGTAYVADATSSMPTVGYMAEGLAYTADGALCVTTAAPSSSSIKIHGYAISANGALHITTATPTAATSTSVGGVLIDGAGSVYVSGFIMITFNLPLTDAGAGIASTTPSASSGSGTPTFTRATVAWTKLSTGLWAQVASGQPRACYLGATTAVAAYGGYFSEQAGIQLVTPDASIRDMTNAAWTATNVTPLKNATGIDGVVNSASTLTCTSNGGSIQQTLTAAASSRTYSVWLRRKTGTGTITLNQGATTLDVTASLNGTTYTRVSLTASVLNAAFGITFGTSGDEVEADFNQFEAGAFPTSPMATAGAARNADVLTYAVLDNISILQGNVYAECAFTNLAASTDREIVAAGNALTSAIIDAFDSVTYRVNDGSLSNDWTVPAVAVHTVQKVAVSYGGVVCSFFTNGAQISPATKVFDGAMNMVTLGIGHSNAARQPYGFMKNIKIYNFPLTAAENIALTT